MRLLCIGLSLLHLLGAMAAHAQLPEIRIAAADRYWAFWSVGTFFRSPPRRQAVKVAVISHGFENATEKLPKLLPASTRLVGPANPVAGAEAELGLRSAALLWMTSGYEEEGLSLQLYDGSTPGFLSEALKQLADWKPDVVLCTENFAGYGNFDGEGVINQTIEDLLDDDRRLWIQSAGAFRGKVRNEKVKTASHKRFGETWVKFGDDWSLRFWVRSHKTDLTLTLSWNSNFNELKGDGRDLDLYVYREESEGRLESEPLFASRLRQVRTPSASAGETVFAMEQLALAHLSPSETPYHIVVKHHAGHFDPRTARLRVTLTSDKSPYRTARGKFFHPVELEGADQDDQIMVPADHRRVFTVGDDSPESAIGPRSTSGSRQKPNLILESRVPAFSDWEAPPSSPHAAAAQFAGVVTAFKARAADFSSPHLRTWLRQLREEREITRPGKTYEQLEDTPPSETEPRKSSDRWRSPSPSEWRKLLGE